MAEAVSGLTGSIQGSLGGLASKGSQWIDSIFPPEKRNALIAKLSQFATEKPMLASFLASQIALTGFPMGLFAVMTITVVIFALLAGIIIGLLGAVLFIVACVGFALIILLPTLFLTTAAATFIWLWGLGGYYILKWFNQKEIPGIHTDLKGGVEDGIKGQLGALTGDDGSQGDPNGAPKEEKKGGEKKGMNGSAPDPKKAADVGKAAGKAQNATDGVKGATDGVKGAVPVPGT